MTNFFSETTIIPIQCFNTTCLNEGKCYVTKEGPKCVCKFGWEGLLCEEMINIKVVAFTGSSYLIHSLSNATSTIIALKLRTLAPNGLLFYAQITTNMYMHMYVQDGYLKFQFSCGIQMMLFSETKYRINTGYETSVLATYDFSL
ncbi:hypothetical protein PGB90_008625 [Kerria lacca]